LRLRDPSLGFLFVQRLSSESRSAECGFDLRSERVALGGEALDRALDRVVDALIRALDRFRRGDERVHREPAKRGVHLFVDLREATHRLAMSNQ
jgi:hypothetical protein